MGTRIGSQAGWVVLPLNTGTAQILRIVEQADIDVLAVRVGELLDESLVVDQTVGPKVGPGKYRIICVGQFFSDFGTF